MKSRKRLLLFGCLAVCVSTASAFDAGFSICKNEVLGGNALNGIPAVRVTRVVEINHSTFVFVYRFAKLGDKVQIDTTESPFPEIVDPAKADAMVKSLSPDGFANATSASTRAAAMAAVPAQSPGAGTANQGLVIADFNGDGVIDSATLTPSRIFIQLFRLDGTILSSASLPLTGLG